jgi:hypothetical protein
MKNILPPRTLLERRTSSNALVLCWVLIITVAGTDRSLVILREGFCQRAGLIWCQVAIADRWYHQTADHRISIASSLCHVCRVCPVGYIQFCGNKLVGQYYKTVTLCRIIQYSHELRSLVSDCSKGEAGHWPRIWMAPPVALCVGAWASYTWQGRGRNRVANPEPARGIKRGGTEHVCRITQQRTPRTRAGYTAAVVEAVIADDDGDALSRA